MKKKRETKKRTTTGPEAKRLVLPEGDWKKNVQTALGKKRPKDGWPKG